MDRGTVIGLLSETVAKWNKHNAPSLGASLAYYAILSLAPLVILVVALYGLFLSQSMAESDLINQARQLAGDAAAETLRSVIHSSRQPASGMVASAIAVATLIFGASGVFVELRQSLNMIWDVPPEASGVRSFLLQRLATFGMVLVLGCLILLSLLISAGIGVGEHYFAEVLPMGTAVISEVLNAVISLGAIATLFALIFKFVPDVNIEWSEVMVGGLVTSVFFTIGRILLALYLSTAAIGSAYGAAGSLVAMVVWVYYSAQIFFFGAIFTRVYAESKRTGHKGKAGAAIN